MEPATADIGLEARPDARRRYERAGRLAVIGAGLAFILGIPVGVVLASHQFSDVPTGSAFHADIDALVDSGVTAGCGGGRFCPTANVTREQMAAFMNRLGALGPGRTPVVNADKLDGLDPTAFEPNSAVVSGSVDFFDIGPSANGARVRYTGQCRTHGAGCVSLCQ